jgi:hypothetical protein
MERELGISYPTVRGRVDALVRALGLGDGDAPTEPDLTDATADAARDAATTRRSILAQLARHEIGAEDAAAALRELQA